MPEHIWSKITDPSKYTNQNPVGTGPFLFKSFDQPTNTVTYVKNPNYWMSGRPYIDKIIYTSVNSNTDCTLLMLKHEYDLSNLYIPGVAQVYIDKDPDNNHYWWPTIGNNYLMFNDTKYPFNIPEFRQAMSMAINRDFILKSTYTGSLSTYDNPTLIPYSQRSWIDPTLTALASSLETYNPIKAQELLASIGFKKNKDGFLTGPDGKLLPVYILSVVAGWTDWDQAANIVAQELEEIGLRINVVQQSGGLYFASMHNGTFDIGIETTGMGITPYYTYYVTLSSAETAPIGQRANGNCSRYTNPLIDDALQVFNSTSNQRIQKQAIYTIERIVLDDMPVISLLPEPIWEVYNTSHLTGFPNDEYPYYIQNTIYQAPEIIALNVHEK